MGPETAPGLGVPDGSPDLGTQDLDSARYSLFKFEKVYWLTNL